MLHARLALSRRRLDVCLLDEAGELVAQTAAPPDADGLRGLAKRLQGERVRAVIESMTGARFIHDTLEAAGAHGRRATYRWRCSTCPAVGRWSEARAWTLPFLTASELAALLTAPREAPP
jgi:transposase